MVADFITSASDVLNAAADYIETNGWSKGHLFDYASTETGCAPAACALGAISVSIRQSDPGYSVCYSGAKDLLAVHLGLSDSDLLPNWNDSQESGEVVVSELRAAARNG